MPFVLSLLALLGLRPDPYPARGGPSFIPLDGTVRRIRSAKTAAHSCLRPGFPRRWVRLSRRRAFSCTGT